MLETEEEFSFLWDIGSDIMRVVCAKGEEGKGREGVAENVVEKTSVESGVSFFFLKKKKTKIF